MSNEQVGEEEQVGASLRKFWHVDSEFVDTVEKILTEPSFFYRLLQVFVGSADKADIDRNLCRAANRTDAAFLKGTQQLHLHVVAKIPHFVEEQRTAVCHFECTVLVTVSTGECTLLMTEEFRSRHIAWYSSAVEGEE